MARYISKDPIGLEGGINTSAYVADPTQWVDPLGLKCTENFTTPTTLTASQVNKYRSYTQLAVKQGLNIVDKGILGWFKSPALPSGATAVTRNANAFIGVGSALLDPDVANTFVLVKFRKLVLDCSNITPEQQRDLLMIFNNCPRDALYMLKAINQSN